jgi:predicted ATP-dependent endonuclease of OLD family
VRFSYLVVDNYKCLDKLRLELPPPSSSGQLDIFAIGSRNGGGKSSVLECLALSFSSQVPRGLYRGLYQGCVRRGFDSAVINAVLQVSGEPCRVSISLNQLVDHEVDHNENLPELKSFCTNVSTESALLEIVAGKKEKALVRAPLLFFPSHRRTVHGSTLLADAHTDLGGSDSDLSQAKGVLSRLWQEFGGDEGAFETLSSGQKEIISTLFTIWSATYHQPSVVLIDEPELHLNAEWQRIFVSKLAELAPKNQYILATHSEEIFASVPKERRLLLTNV